MIEILPLENKERENELLSPLGETSDTAKIFMMSEGENELGYVACKLIGSTLLLIKFEVNGSENMASFEKDFYLDTLMRSAASFGENHGADSIETFDNKYNDFLKKKGFSTDLFHAFAPMSLIVHYE